MLHAARDNEQLTRVKVDIPLPQLDRHATAENEEELVRLIMGMPGELAADLDNGDLVVVQVGDDARGVWLVEQGQLRREVDLVVHTGHLTYGQV